MIFSSDGQALDLICGAGFRVDNGFISPPIGFTWGNHDVNVASAIDYLCDEWDYAYQHKNYEENPGDQAGNIMEDEDTRLTPLPE